MSSEYCQHGVEVSTTVIGQEQRCWKCEPPTFEDLREARTEGWDAAVKEACKKVMALQRGFRNLLKSKRAELLADTDRDRPASSGDEYTAAIAKRERQHRELETEVSQGEALVGALGDAVRSIAAMKDEMP